MTSKAALCKALLEGKIVNIKNGFTLLGITNVPREIGRSIERLEDNGFGVTITRTERQGTSRYGQPTQWVDYTLDKSLECNRVGIIKMREYINKELGNAPVNVIKSKTKQSQLF